MLGKREKPVLPEDFQFSQGKLQDYVDCARRFQLRYVLMQPWPSVIAEPAAETERHWQRGAAFHRLAHQHTLGLDPGLLESTIDDDTLRGWWRTYLEHPPDGLPGDLRRAEVAVGMTLAGHRLVAKFDLLAAGPEQLVVVDWKTMLKRPSRAALAKRLQTRVYRFLAVEAGAGYMDGLVPRPGQVLMVYWFAQAGGATERFPYDGEQHAADREYLNGLTARIGEHRERIWPLTPDEHRCRFCNYRSLCERGVQAGFLADLDEDEEPVDLEIDLEQIAEIEF